MKNLIQKTQNNPEAILLIGILNEKKFRYKKRYNLDSYFKNLKTKKLYIEIVEKS